MRLRIVVTFVEDPVHESENTMHPRRPLQSLDRRSMVALGASATVAAVLGHHVAESYARQGSSALSPVATTTATATIMPTSDGYDLPLVTWDLRDDRIAVSPETFEAGWSRLIVANNGSSDDHLATFLLPDGKTSNDLLTTLSNQNATVPDWIINAVIAGNPDHAAQGSTAEGFVRYDPGPYLIIDPFSARIGSFTVSQGASGTQSPPKPAVTVGMIEMDFTGLEKPVPAGRNLWLVENRGETFHELVFGRTPVGTTKDQVQDVIQTSFATPTYNPGNGWELPAGDSGLGLLSKERQSAIYVDLPAGTYAAMCFAPMNFTGPPHAAMGMIRMFTVA
jgi:hypothetical protein